MDYLSNPILSTNKSSLYTLYVAGFNVSSNDVFFPKDPTVAIEPPLLPFLSLVSGGYSEGKDGYKLQKIGAAGEHKYDLSVQDLLVFYLAGFEQGALEGPFPILNDNSHDGFQEFTHLLKGRATFSGLRLSKALVTPSPEKA